MAVWTFSCWSCRQETEMEDKVMRDNECPHCRLDMRSCKNCQYYDPGAHNDCRETIAEYVPEKERANFCGMWTAFQGERDPGEDINAAKAKLEALFKKK
ncbi:MAG: hypothetical protein A2289_26885 [Deltaproteobacteria bacterium RIFOXYA12_FULL_58_15]|nr:MAG: hypothetical protein A2289_26885 [Deltaproteobacteria bacterium RIFOXYA12_FULL_58_15]OGR09317.1 MAG: hypothetical protein A2341_02080 [Deltaproteobacteria bacterium RIFOXYB12_FULL_58_9]